MKKRNEKNREISKENIYADQKAVTGQKINEINVMSPGKVIESYGNLCFCEITRRGVGKRYGLFNISTNNGQFILSPVVKSYSENGIEYFESQDKNDMYITWRKLFEDDKTKDDRKEKGRRINEEREKVLIEAAQIKAVKIKQMGLRQKTIEKQLQKIVNNGQDLTQLMRDPELQNLSIELSQIENILKFII